MMNIRPATPAEAESLDDSIADFNNSQVPFTQKNNPVFMKYVAEENGIVAGGITAVVYHWGILFVDILFVDENQRGKNLGSALLQKVEQEAKSFGATIAHLDTFDFQAKDFYLKHGYTIFGVLDDCPKGHQRYYLKKIL